VVARFSARIAAAASCSGDQLSGSSSWRTEIRPRGNFYARWQHLPQKRGIVIPRRCCSVLRSDSRSASHYEEYEGEHEAYDEQNPRNIRCRARDSAKAEYRGDETDDQKNDCPIKHVYLLGIFVV
jgi:hypothetical protein